MKKCTVLLASTLSTVCFAGSFECRSTEGHIAELSISERRLDWFEPKTSAGTRGEFLEPDDARFGETFGYLVYDLLDFYRSDDSHFLLKIDPAYGSLQSFRAVLTFSRDDKETYERFECVKVRR